MTAPLLAATVALRRYIYRAGIALLAAAGYIYLAAAPVCAQDATLSFTLPLHPRTTCSGTLPSLLADTLEWRAYVRVQSPAWIAMRPAMLADPSVWAAIWPIVRAEAEPRTVASGRAMPGTRINVTVADTLTAPHWYSAASRNGRGWSCESPAVAR